MEDFKTITTQEEFDERIKERLVREAKKYEKHISPDELEKIKEDYQKQIDELNTSIQEKASQYADFDNQIDDYKKQIAKYETDSVKTRVAIDMGIPLELKDRLKGTTEDEIREDAKILSGFASNKKKPPLYSPDPVYTKEDLDKAKLNEGYKQMLKNL